jgi:hypothetical protein
VSDTALAAGQYGHCRPWARQASETGSPPTALLAYLHRDANSCIASFIGGLTVTTRNAIDGVADLIIGEAAVVLDFSRVDLVDIGGARAAARMIRAILLGGSHLQITEPMRPESRAFLLERSVGVLFPFSDDRSSLP